LFAVILVLLYAALILFGVSETIDETFASFLKKDRSALFRFLLVVFPFVQLSDFIFRLIFKSKTISQPVFMQTLPVGKHTWYRFVLLKNLVHPLNFVPVALFLCCFGRYASPTENICAVLLLWMMAVCNNALCIWLWNFAQKVLPETFSVARHSASGIKDSSLSFLKMELLYILRTKRLRMMFLISLIILVEVYWASNNKSSEVLAMMDILLPVGLLGQYIFGVEANFINGLWTKPVSLQRIFEVKYYFYMLVTLANSLLLLPLVLTGRLDPSGFLVMLVVAICLTNLLMFPMILLSERLDINSSSFMNYQGTSMVAMIYAVIACTLSVVLHTSVCMKRTDGQDSES
jgi:hypothetical protein